ncbi:MAG: hypothetical protein AAB759_03515 [Patescibacteria group bacterium]
MKKTLLIVLVVIALAAVALGVRWYYGAPAADDETAATRTQPPAEALPDSGTDRSQDLVNAAANIQVGDPNADFDDVNRDTQGL